MRDTGLAARLRKTELADRINRTPKAAWRALAMMLVLVVAAIIWY